MGTIEQIKQIHNSPEYQRYVEARRKAFKVMLEQIKQGGK